MTTEDPESPYLLTPGPLTTSRRTRQAMLRDWGSWDAEFRAMTAEVRRGLDGIAGGGEAFTTVPMQGSGSFVVEAMLGTFVPREGACLVCMNGAYGQRMARQLEVMGRRAVTLDKGDYAPPTAEEVDAILAADASITHVAVVHCETSSGIINPVEAIAEAVARRGRRLLVDAMSSFGAVPLDLARIACDAVAASANKCLEGVPGCGWVVARKAALQEAAGNAHSHALDLHDQWVYMERTGQWRFTPPTHVMAALAEALVQHREEGGTAARGARYARNRDVLVDGMRDLGFRTLLGDNLLSPIITTFHSPGDPAFAFAAFYEGVKRRGFILYPGKLTVAETFRVGCIGQVFEAQMRGAVAAIGATLAELGVRSAAPAPGAEAA